MLADDPPSGGRRSPDLGDDYLADLAESTGAVLVTGDGDLLALRGELPISSPMDVLQLLEA